MFALAFLISAVAAGNELPARQSFGYAALAYVYISADLVEMLSLTDEQRSLADELTRNFYARDGENRLLRATLSSVVNRVTSIDTYFDELQGVLPDAKEFNARAFTAVDNILEGPSQKAMFRRFLTQRLISDGELDTLIALHNVKVSRAKFARLCAQVIAADKVQRDSDELLRYRAGMRILAKYIPEERLKTIAGEEYKKTLHPSMDGMEIGFRNSNLSILGDPMAQVELGLNAKQVLKLSPPIGELRTQLREETVQKLGQEKREDAIEIIETWNTKLGTDVLSLLTETQLARLRQLDFQRHVRCMNLGAAMRIAKVNTDQIAADSIDVTRAIQIEAWYRLQLANFNLYYPIFEELVGVSRARQLAGKFKISYSPWRHHDVESDEAILQHVLTDVEPKPETNPRRSRRN